MMRKKMTIKKRADLSYRSGHAESGVVFFYILVGVALFAALAYSLSRGSSQNTSHLDDRRAELEASTIINFSSQVEQGFQNLIRRGCSESDIAMEGNHHHGGYSHPTTPGDNRCQLFHPAGANLIYYDPPLEIHVDGLGNHFQNWWFTKIRVAGRGDTDCIDQLVTLRNIDEKLCRAINKAVNPEFSEIPANSHWGWGGGDWFLGQSDFSCDSGFVSFNRPDFADTNIFCFDAPNSGYHYVHIIHER